VIWRPALVQDSLHRRIIGARGQITAREAFNPDRPASFPQRSLILRSDLLCRENTILV